ncbi:predicted protein [Naegleria gruberi]|uniref:Predicted protein n=1 Tax=Naegleria gruberi TaxID=5762 RepID=D2V5X8_NAEGR|nr:uncharacterized protein NAEGRDRAFT_64238 [Naegleria gruberi]EFC47874.1 predicted protein [Naegleria gruberi]|eukprot:XP_002680618.1 predicted protein [Naegleria gruberi strain NEG-M]
MLESVKQVLEEIKIKRVTEKDIETPFPLVVLSDFISDNEDCQIIAGYMLQFVEEQLASAIHISSNHTTLLEEECGSISLKSNDEKIASFVNGEITLPDEKIAKVIDAIIKTEADEIKGTLKQMSNIMSSLC